MKKLLLIVACCLGLTISAVAQPHAIGVRVGQNAELSFQQEVNRGNILQIDLGGYAYRGVQASITYAWRSQVNGSSASGAWSSYGGFGVGGGYAPSGRNVNFEHEGWGRGRTTSWYLSERGYRDACENAISKGKSYVSLYDYGFFGILGLVGFEYELSSVPLSLAIDYRPMIGIDVGKRVIPDGKHNSGIKFHTPGLWDVAFCVRYVF